MTVRGEKSEVLEIEGRETRWEDWVLMDRSGVATMGDDSDYMLCRSRLLPLISL